MFNFEEYKSFYCKMHRKYIHFFKKDNSFNETPCWECIREANNKEFKLTRIKDQFHQEFEELFSPNTFGGIVSVVVSHKEINVSIEDSSEVCNQLPKSYQGLVLNKLIVGVDNEHRKY